MDACIGKMLVRHMIVGGQQEVHVNMLLAQCETLSNLLRNEYLIRDPRGFPETVHHRIGVL